MASAFRHERSEGLDDLLPHLLDLLSEHVPRSRGESSRLTSLLQKAGKLSTPAGMALEARQLLLERSLPSREEEMAGTLAALREAVNGPPGHPRGYPGGVEGEDVGAVGGRKGGCEWCADGGDAL